MTEEFIKGHYYVPNRGLKATTAAPNNYIFKQHTDSECLWAVKAIGESRDWRTALKFKEKTLWRKATIDEIAEYKSREGPYKVSELKPKQINAGWYVVCLRDPKHDGPGIKHGYVYQQKLTRMYLYVEKGINDIRTAFDSTEQGDWRHATVAEIHEYNNRGKPYKASELSPREIKKGAFWVVTRKCSTATYLKTNYIYLQLKTSETPYAAVDSLGGETPSGDLKRSGKWRYATHDEINAYIQWGKPLDVSQLSCKSGFKVGDTVEIHSVGAMYDGRRYRVISIESRTNDFMIVGKELITGNPLQFHTKHLKKVTQDDVIRVGDTVEIRSHESKEWAGRQYVVEKIDHLVRGTEKGTSRSMQWYPKNVKKVINNSLINSSNNGNTERNTERNEEDVKRSTRQADCDSQEESKSQEEGRSVEIGRERIELCSDQSISGDTVDIKGHLLSV